VSLLGRLLGHHHLRRLVEFRHIPLHHAQFGSDDDGGRKWKSRRAVDHRLRDGHLLVHVVPSFWNVVGILINLIGCGLYTYVKIKEPSGGGGGGGGRSENGKV